MESKDDIEKRRTLFYLYQANIVYWENRCNLFFPHPGQHPFPPGSWVGRKKMGPVWGFGIDWYITKDLPYATREGEAISWEAYEVTSVRAQFIKHIYIL